MSFFAKLPGESCYMDLLSPIGTLWIVASDAGVHAILFANGVTEEIFQRFSKNPDHPVLMKVAIQLREYFAGQRKDFDLPLAPFGTEFQHKVWNELRRIPFGKTASYGEQAQKIGQPRAIRAVGTANGRNPIAIVVPCHRVIGKNGSLTGFAGGLPNKKFLLTLEQSK